MALRALQSYGLTESHLRRWQPNEEDPSFEDEHRWALVYLMEEEDVAPEAAIQEINGLSDEQAKAPPGCSVWVAPKDLADDGAAPFVTS